MRTEFNEKEKERLEELRTKYQELEDHIKSMQTKITSMKKEQDKVFAELFRLTHPEYKATFDQRLKPYGW